MSHSPNNKSAVTESILLSGAMLDEADPYVLVSPFNEPSVEQIMRIGQNDNNKGHLTDTEHNRDVMRMLGIFGHGDIRRVVDGSALPDSGYRDYAITIGGHLCEPAGMHVTSPEVVGGVRDQSRSGGRHEIIPYVDLAHTRMGIGTRASRMLIDKIFREGLRAVYMDVGSNNAGGVRLAERLGMEEEKRLSDDTIRFEIRRSKFKED